MPQFQSLKRLLTFYLMTLIMMLILYYAMMVVVLKKNHQEQSLQALAAFKFDILSLNAPSNDDIENILAKPMFQNLSYQLILMQPSGQTYIHRANRSDEPKFATVIFPHQHSDDYTLTNHVVTATFDLNNNAQVYLVIKHRPIHIDWTAYESWLPLIVAISLFIGALLFILKRRSNWEQVLTYTDQLINDTKESYVPPPFDNASSPIEFLRLGHLLGRISHDLHQKHRRIKMLNHRLERLVDKAPLPMLLVMRQGQISFFNQRFEQIFTTNFQRGISYKLTDFVTGSDKTTQQALSRLGDQKVARTLLVYGLEDKLAYQLHMTPWFGEHGQIHGFTAVLSNVDKWLNQTQTFERQLESQNQTILEMTRLRSVIGHELRTPLNAIIGTLDLIDSEDFTAKQKEILATLMQSSQSMLMLLNDMLEMAKIESGNAVIVDEPVDIFKVSQNTSTLMIGSARRKGLELVYAFMPNCPRYIHTDPIRLRQILLNLLDNSIKFTPSGHVALIVDFIDSDQMLCIAQDKLNEKKSKRDKALSTVAITHIEPPVHHWLEDIAQKQQSWIRFRIQDTGIGISEEEQQQLFSYFNQANSQIQRQFGGSGLGLAISNSFANLLGGFIVLTSQSDHGSCFDLFLPSQYPEFRPLYLSTHNFSHIHLIGVINNPIREYHLQRLGEHLALTTQLYATIDEIALDDIKATLSKLPATKTPILLIDYEYYLAAHETFAHNLFTQLIEIPNLAKILMSMKSERGISSALLDQFDSFLNKPLDVALLLSELTRLTQMPFDVNLKLLPPNLNQSHHPDAIPQLASSQSTALTSITDPIDPLTATKSSLILVVEDNPTNQKITQKLLEKLGYISLLAEDGEKALEVLKAHRQDIALILMDCRMPNMDGLQATQAIRAMGDDITIVALTANNSDEDKAECLAVGMNDFLAKPINKDQLKNVLVRFLST